MLLDQIHPWCSLWDTGLAVVGYSVVCAHRCGCSVLVGSAERPCRGTSMSPCQMLEIAQGDPPRARHGSGTPVGFSPTLLDRLTKEIKQLRGDRMHMGSVPPEHRASVLVCGSQMPHSYQSPCHTPLLQRCMPFPSPELRRIRLYFYYSPLFPT